ncbi:MAG: hypothetical protein HN597_03540 [Desulfobacula sp.]|jgi:hypothetical protein|uniref:Uncharacterized protein n=1 Tax=uncultured marine virus TaxID=186617 RepID=A0A0F7L4W3_9VIRU|nr:hypothetical protein [uncultured marine virus]MBT7628763.1 hypothetical protein [Desulfobacula sp.]
MRKISLITMALCLVFLASCSMKNLTPVEQASVIGAESSKTYISLYNTYVSLEGVLEGEALEKLKKTAPAFDQAKICLIAYNDLVIKWRVLGGGEPVELIKNKELLNSLLAEISTVLISLM